MTDRGLLELAAKACGFVTSRRINAERLQMDPPVIGLVIDGVSTNWNPLEDDGDALRLAVMLEIDLVISISHPSKVAAWCSAKQDYLERQHDGDAFSATRRAIVRAAAEIGKMTEER